MISERKEREAEATARPLEGGLILLMTLGFIAAVVKLVGFRRGNTYILAAVFSPLGGISLAQKYRWRGVLGYAIGLGALLGVALALK